jgi:fumarylacetoacetase
MASWLDIPASSHFSLANIPFGIISTASNPTHRPATAIGDYALDLAAFAKGNGFSGNSTLEKQAAVFSSTTLNALAALGRPFHRELRSYLQEVFAKNSKHASLLKDNSSLREAALVSLKDVTNHLPMTIGDYTDFYAGKHHAFNIGCLFRGPDNALQPNYTHLPVAYHGRASSVVVSGTPIRRPWGQILADPKAEPKVPTFTPCRRFDIELELGMFICGGNEMGKPIPVGEADESVFGYVLMNDWSARDIQAWEYVPLGPFTSKNGGTSISPWVVLADAMESFKTPGIPNDSQISSYLQENKKDNLLDIDFEIDLISTFKLTLSPD